MFYIIGPRGAGKTTIGKTLADNKSYQFIDTDSLIMQQTGMTIAELVEQKGWDYFRQVESDVLMSIQQPNCVISTGGGIILAEQNREFMKNKGVVIYLHTSPEILAARLLAAPETEQRPSLTGKSILEEMEEVMAMREPFYLSTAHHVIDAGMSIEAIVKQLERLSDQIPA